jgi:hypothetical protein
MWLPLRFSGHTGACVLASGSTATTTDRRRSHVEEERVEFVIVLHVRKVRVELVVVLHVRKMRVELVVVLHVEEGAGRARPRSSRGEAPVEVVVVLRLGRSGPRSSSFLAAGASAATGRSDVPGAGRRSRLRRYVHGRQDDRGCALGRRPSFPPSRRPSTNGARRTHRAQGRTHGGIPDSRGRTGWRHEGAAGCAATSMVAKTTVGAPLGAVLPFRPLVGQTPTGREGRTAPKGAPPGASLFSG